MFAEVVLAKASPRLDKIYHYSIPESLQNKIIVGSQVEIPFGAGDRIGYVVGLVEKSDIQNIKPITSLASETPAFNSNGLKLARWMSEYYLCWFISALRAILPPKTRNKNVKRRPAKCS